MCVFCGIENTYKKQDLFSKSFIDTYVNGVISGKISVEKLDVELYEITAKEFEANVIKGFGKADGAKQEKLLKKLIQSVYPFAAAKQYQCVREILALPEKDKFNEAVKKFNLYYVDYFSSEIDTCEYQGKSAKQWLEIEDWNNG